MNGCTVPKRGQDSRVGKGKQGGSSAFSKMETTGRLLCFVETRSHFVAQVGLKLTV